MNILELLKNLFKKNTTHIDTCSLIDIKNLIQIPKRNKYKQNKTLLDKIDEFKKEYKSILTQDKTVTSIDLHSKKLQDELNKFLNILNENYFSIGGYTGLDILDEETLLSYKTNLLKLGIYKDKIKELQKEIELRLIALNELSIRIKLSRSKNKDALNEEITNLSYAYYIYENEYMAIEKAIESFKHIVLTNTSKITQDYDKYKEARLKRMSSYLKDILPDIYKKLKDVDEEAKLALYEFYLEIFAHDKEHIKEAKRQIKFIEQEIRIDNLDDLETRENLHKQIINAEPLIRTIYDFNKEEISDDELKEFYNSKYIVLTYHLEDDTPFKNAYDMYRDNVEYTIYETIIQEKIEALVNGNVHGDFKDKVILIQLKDIFKTNNIYDVDAILANPTLVKLLNLIIPRWFFSSDESFNFFNNTYIEISGKYCIDDNPGLVLDKKISIRCMYELFTLDDLVQPETAFSRIAKNNNISQDNNLEYKLFRLYCFLIPKKYSDGVYQIPEGIIKLDIEGPFTQIYTNLKRKLKKSNLYILLPNTMREFGLEIIEGNYVQYLELNEGLKKVYMLHDEHYNSPIEVEDLIIPSTLESINLEYFNTKELKQIEFNNYEDSKILKNKYVLKSLLLKLIDAKNISDDKTIIRNMSIFRLIPIILKNSEGFIKIINITVILPRNNVNSIFEIIDKCIDQIYEKIEEFKNGDDSTSNIYVTLDEYDKDLKLLKELKEELTTTEKNEKKLPKKH